MTQDGAKGVTSVVTSAETRIPSRKGKLVPVYTDLPEDQHDRLRLVLAGSKPRKTMRQAMREALEAWMEKEGASRAH